VSEGGPRALVTGASSGFGAAFARALRKRGHSLVLVARRHDRLLALQQELGGEKAVAVVSADLAAPGGPAGVLKELEAKGVEIDLLVNNAGVGLTTPFLDQPVDRILGMVDLNVRAVVELTRALLPPMVRRGRGGVINVSSIAAFQPVPYMAVYSATKALTLSFTEAVAYELRGTGVRMQALCPGPTATEFLDMSQTHSGLLVRRMPMLRTEEVVEQSLEAFDRGKLRVVPGFVNRVTGVLGRLSPTALNLAVTARLFKPRPNP
jgi:short-subunit dehydrogenase